MSLLVHRFRSKNGKAREIGDVQGGFGFFAFLWECLARKHAIPFYHPAPSRDPRGTHWEPVWDLFGKDGVPEYEQIVLGATLGRMIVRRTELPRLIVALRRFCQEHGEYQPTTSQLIEIWEREAGEVDTEAVGLSLSVNCDYWEVQLPTGHRAYCIFTDTDHYYLFDQLRVLGIQG